MNGEHFDVIIIGAGLGGGIAAGVLAEAGRRVLLLERGRTLEFGEIAQDHLRNHRLSLYGDNTTENLSSQTRVFVDAAGREHLVQPHQNNFNHNAFTTGGGARIWGMQAWRFHPDDFRMASRYGVPAGSSLADWPISYGELAPYYDRAEHEVGVAGDHTGDTHAPRSRPFPLLPVPQSSTGAWLARGANALGWKTFTPPLAVNTQPYLGREACIQCGQCIGFACPTDAKNGSHNTLLPRALATSHCTFVTQAQVTRITTGQNGRVDGVEYFAPRRDSKGNAASTSASPHYEPHSARADVVIVASGAIESARLLLLSSSAAHPHGLGNHSGHLGRHVQGHYYPVAYGILPRGVENPNLGPGVTIATTQFNHGNPGVIGGAMLANDFVKLPIIFWRSSLPPDVPRWGLANKRAMRDLYLRGIDVRGPVQEIPSPDSRVTLDPRVRDVFGLPAARLSGTTHPETVRTANFIRFRAEEWLRASGAERVWSWPVERKFSAGQHQAGTCRMSADPQDGVTDPFGRVHGHNNLFVCDGSLHVTNGGFNPGLTIMALAFRAAERIARSAF
ncbi:MAG: GMC family oxidoreductase [Opitutaceae bacterium]